MADPQHDLKAMRQMLDVTRALHAGAERWPEVCALVAESETPHDAVDQVMALLGTSEVGALAVLDTQVRRLAIFERRRLADRVGELEEQLAEMENGHG